ncbi:MAG TPA: peptidylprolyl isomerase [Anaerolineae bacterium]|jgi:FKBP-type peptidyl-prolyl cis-trans isomerase 2|nr:peptidylprolyl isomerase [Anaerolineae bacterium]
MSIKNGSEVTFAYRLFSGDELMDETLPGQPMVYTQGEGYLIPGLEKAMEGLKEGDKKEIIVAPEGAYGVRSDDKIIHVPRANIPKDADVHEGSKVPAKTPEGDMIVGTVTEANDESITVDFNHELAGRTLRFEIEVIKVSK